MSQGDGQHSGLSSKYTLLRRHIQQAELHTSSTLLTGSNRAAEQVQALGKRVPGAPALVRSQRLCWRQGPQQARGCWKPAPLQAQELPGLLQHASAPVSPARQANREGRWHASSQEGLLHSSTRGIQDSHQLCTILCLHLQGYLPRTTCLSEVKECCRVCLPI